MRKANLIPYRSYNDSLEFYLQLRSKNAKQYPDSWGFWGGGIESDESPEQAMVRELKEELTITIENYEFLGVFHDSIPNERHVYYTKVDEDFEKDIEIHEGQGGKFFTKEEIEKEEKMLPEDKQALFKLFDILNV